MWLPKCLEWMESHFEKCFKWYMPPPENASNIACNGNCRHPILAPKAPGRKQNCFQSRSRTPKIASNGASQLPKLLPILLAMEELGFQNGKTASNVPSNFPCNGRAWLPKWRALLQMSQAISHAISAGLLATSQAISHVVSHAPTGLWGDWVICKTLKITQNKTLKRLSNVTAHVKAQLEILPCKRVPPPYYASPPTMHSWQKPFPTQCRVGGAILGQHKPYFPGGGVPLMGGVYPLP